MLKKILKNILAFIIFNLKIVYCVAIFFIISLIILSKSSLKSNQKPVISNYKYVVFDIDKVKEENNPTLAFFNDDNINFNTVINSLNNIRLNKNVEALIINLDTLRLSPSQIEEFMKILKKFPMSNKKIYAYGSNIDNVTYRLASVADKIVMPNTLSARLSLNGYYSNQLYFKDIFDKYGVKVEAIHVGSHKSFGEQYYLNKMSDELRSDLTRVFDNRLNNFALNISKNRKLDINTFKINILDGKYDSISPYTAKDYGLIDEIMDYDMLMEKLNATDDNTISLSDIAQQNMENNSKNTIAIVPLEGNITSSNEDLSDLTLSEKNVRNKFEQIEKNKNIKAVILRINSPGGSALEAEMIHKLIKRYTDTYHIPIYASLSDVAASGGYYIATSAKKIFANEATITGSIGVVSLLPKFDKAFNKFNINSQVIQKGKYAGIYDPSYSLTDGDRTHLQNILQDVYTEFKHRVSVARNIPDEKLEPLAGGRIWLGDEAKNIGLIDDIASLDEVIDIVAKECNLTDYNVTQINTKMDYSNYLDFAKSIFNSNTKLDIYDNIYKKLLFIQNNSLTPLYFNTSLNKLKY